MVIKFNTGSDNGLLPDSTKPLPQPMLNSDWRGSVTSTSEQFQLLFCIKKFQNYTFKIIATHPRGQWVKSEKIFGRSWVYLIQIHKMLNSLWHRDDIRGWRSWSTQVQVMACCLTAPSHYLNQCWLTISEVLWHPFHSNYYSNTKDINPQVVFQL